MEVKKSQSKAMKLFQLLRETMPFLVGYDVLNEYGFVAPNAFRKYFCTFTSISGRIVLVSATILAGGFLVFEAETFDEIHDHFSECATALNYTFYSLCMHWMCKHFFDLNDNFEQIVIKRSINKRKRQIYKKACEFVETSSNYIYIGHVKIAIPFTTIPYLFVSYFNYYITELPPNDAFSLPFAMWAIFDWRTPTAYIFAFLLQFFAAAYIIVIASNMMTHALGSCCILIAFIDDIKTDLKALDVYKRNKISEVKLYEHLTDFVHLRRELKQLLSKFIDTYTLPFVMNLLWATCTIAVGLISLQMELKQSEIDLPAISKDITLTFGTLVAFVIICSVGEELQGRFENLNIYQRCNWYQYPIKMRRIFTIILIDSHNLDVFKMILSLTASRETCKKVINGGFITIVVLHTILN